MQLCEIGRKLWNFFFASLNYSLRLFTWFFVECKRIYLHVNGKREKKFNAEKKIRMILKKKIKWLGKTRIIQQISFIQLIKHFQSIWNLNELWQAHYSFFWFSIFLKGKKTRLLLQARCFLDKVMFLITQLIISIRSVVNIPTWIIWNRALCDT